MKKSILLIALFAAVPAFGQVRTIPHVTIKAIEARMTDMESSLFLLDSLYQDYLNVGAFFIQDGPKTDMSQDGSSWLYNKYVYLPRKYRGECKGCKEKIDELRKLQEEEEHVAQETVYRNLIQKADEYFAQRNFLKAKELYQRAVNFRPNDPYPKNKLAEVDSILAEQEKKGKE